jgi:hypothetical protein
MDNDDLQIAAHNLHREAMELRPYQSKMGILFDGMSLEHECGVECEDPCLVICDDTPVFFRFIIIGVCPRCKMYVWSHQSVDSDHRVLYYGKNFELTHQGILAKEDDET